MTTATPTSPRQAAESAMARLLGRLQMFVPTADGRSGDRGALAALRRAAGRKPGEMSEADAIVFESLPLEVPDEHVDALFTVATLFAIHPVHGEPTAPDPESGRQAYRAGRSFGASLRAIRFREGTSEENPGVARRFVAALDAPRDLLPVYLRHLITLLRSRAEHVPIDYRQLFRDLLDWEHPDRFVQRSWAAGFWGGRPPAEQGASDAAAGQSSESSDTQPEKE